MLNDVMQEFIRQSYQVATLPPILLCLLKIVLHVTAIFDAIFDLILIISVSFNSLTLKIVTIDGRK